MGGTYRALESKVGARHCCRSSGGRDGGDLSPYVGGGHSWLVAVRGWWGLVAISPSLV